MLFFFVDISLNSYSKFSLKKFKQKSNYFKNQADVQLGAIQNYSSVTPTAQFIDYSNFNPTQDPASQYLAYRGIQGNVNPVDVGGYGFDYEAFLRAQLGEESYA